METTNFIIVSGCAGAGKTILSKILCNNIHAIYVNKDTVCEKFTNLVLKTNGFNVNSRENSFYKDFVRPVEYQTTFDLCKENLRLKNDVILEIPLIAEIGDYQKLDNLIDFDKMKNENILVKIIWIKHNEKLEHERISLRNFLRDQNKLKNWEEYSESVKNIVPTKEINPFIFDGENFEQELVRLENWLNQMNYDYII